MVKLRVKLEASLSTEAYNSSYHIQAHYYSPKHAEYCADVKLEMGFIYAKYALPCDISKVLRGVVWVTGARGNKRNWRPLS